MLTALVMGAIGSSALIVGGALGSRWAAPRSVSGVLLAFASGTLIAALSFELFPDAVEISSLGVAGGGLVAGAAVFVVINALVDARLADTAGDRADVPLGGAAADELAGASAHQTEKLEAIATRDAGDATTASGAPGAPGLGVALALLAAVTLDGVPENLALGLSLLEANGEGARTSAPLLVAIVASNLPEALVGAIAMRSAGRSAGFVIGVWTATAVVLTAAVVIGYGALSGAPDSAIGFALAFAGGAVLASLADTLMPEAFEHGRPFNAFATAAGFFLSFVLSG